MATTLSDAKLLDSKYPFPLRKLHSLCGIVPMGVFLCEHMLTNSMAFGVGGAEKFNDSVHFLHGLPYLWALELFGIFLPFAFHIIYGIVIALTMAPNVRAYNYVGNWRYFFQRITAYFAFGFIVIHLFNYRFAHWAIPEKEFIGSLNPFELTRDGLYAWTPFGGAQVAAWFMIALYWIGLAAVCFHFANGIWSFCITWGIAISEKAQRRVGVLAAAIGILLFLGGGLGLVGLKNAETQIAPATEEAPMHHEEAPMVAVLEG